MLEHYVVYAAVPGHEADLDETLAEFCRDAKEEGGAIVHEISWGRNTNPSGLDRGHTHGCRSLIESGRFTEYWELPAHKRLLDQLDALTTGRFAMDYETTSSGASTAVPPQTQAEETR